MALRDCAIQRPLSERLRSLPDKRVQLSGARCHSCVQYKDAIFVLQLHPLSTVQVVDVAAVRVILRIEHNRVPLSTNG